MRHVHDVLFRLSQRLLEAGAKLEFGGSLSNYSDVLTKGIIAAAAAWALYVQLATRIATQKLDPEGSAQEALRSLYTLFGSVRETLLAVGPDAVDGPDFVGPLAVRLLNEGLRPFLTTWHNRLAAHEHRESIRLSKDHGDAGPLASPTASGRTEPRNRTAEPNR